MNKLETRSFEVEIRAEKKDNDAGTISGYAAVFEKMSEELGIYTKFREKIAKGAFADSIGDDIRALWSHDSNQVLGRTKNGTLTLKEDDIGLAFTLSLPDTATGRDAFALISRGDVSGMSFGFVPEDDEWLISPDGDSAIRTIKKAKLYEISPTAFPAYPQTTVNTRDLKSLEELAQKTITQNKTHPIAILKQKIALALIA